MILWLVPIRYWEDADKPIECKLLEKPTTGESLHLYVFHSEYGHECWVPAERCFQNKDNAIKAAKLLTQLMELKLEDESEWLIDNILFKRECPQFGDKLTDGSIPPIKKKAGHPRTGYVVYPRHQIERGNPIGYAGDCVKKEVIHWDRWEADKDAEAQSEQRCPMAVVEVTVQPIEKVCDT